MSRICKARKLLLRYISHDVREVRDVRDWLTGCCGGLLWILRARTHGQQPDVRRHDNKDGAVGGGLGLSSSALRDDVQVGLELFSTQPCAASDPTRVSKK